MFNFYKNNFFIFDKGKPEKLARSFHLKNYQFQRKQNFNYMNTLVFTRNGEKFVEHQEWDEFSPMVTDKFQKIKEDEGILLVINMNIIIYFNLKHTRSLSHLLI